MVERPGPPLVMTTIRSNTLKLETVSMTTTKNVVGRSDGRVTFQNRCQALAPSTSAAS